MLEIQEVNEITAISREKLSVKLDKQDLDKCKVYFDTKLKMINMFFETSVLKSTK